jgi:hypothetical protein
MRLEKFSETASAAFTLTFCHDGSVQALAQLRRELVNLVFSVDRDRLPSGVQNHFAVMALTNVILYFGKEARLDLSVKIIGKLGKKISAGHGVMPPFFCLK